MSTGEDLPRIRRLAPRRRRRPYTRHLKATLARRFLNPARALALQLLRLTLAVTIVFGSTLAASPRPVQAQFATGGAGRYIEGIDWFQWGTTDGEPIPAAGLTRTNTRNIGSSVLATTCTISPPSGPLFVYRSGDWVGDGFDDNYNIGGTGTAN